MRSSVVAIFPAILSSLTDCWTPSRAVAFHFFGDSPLWSEVPDCPSTITLRLGERELLDAGQLPVELRL